MKVGKTHLAAQSEKSLLCAFEPGANALNNKYVQPIKTWSDFKKLVRQLNNEQVKEKFYTLIIDTVDIAYDTCQKWICNENSVAEIGDIPYGAGYKMVDKEFYSVLRDIAFLGYGIIFIAHETIKEQERDNGEKYMQIVPDLQKRCAPIIEGFADVVGYLKNTDYIDESGTRKTARNVYLMGDDRFLAGSRFQPIKPKVDMNYQAVIDAFYEAIDKTAAADGVVPTNEMSSFVEPSFEELIEKAKAIWAEVIAKGKLEQVTQIMTTVFGKPTKFSEITVDEIDKLKEVLSQIEQVLGGE